MLSQLNFSPEWKSTSLGRRSDGSFNETKWRQRKTHAETRNETRHAKISARAETRHVISLLVFPVYEGKFIFCTLFFLIIFYTEE